MMRGAPIRSRRSCSISSASKWIRILPVPRHAISAGEKLAQRQRPSGISVKCSKDWVGSVMEYLMQKAASQGRDGDGWVRLVKNAGRRGGGGRGGNAGALRLAAEG